MNCNLKSMCKSQVQKDYGLQIIWKKIKIIIKNIPDDGAQVFSKLLENHKSWHIYLSHKHSQPKFDQSCIVQLSYFCPFKTVFGVHFHFLLIYSRITILDQIASNIYFAIITGLYLEHNFL